MMISRQTIARFIAALFVFGLILGTSATASAQKIAVVDLQKALNSVAEGKAAKKRLKKDFESKQKKLDSQQKALLKKKQELESGLSMLSEDAKRKKVMEYQQEMYTLQQTYMQLQGELSQAEAKATKKIFDKMGKILEKIGKEKGYDLIVEKNAGVIYAKETLDITKELIKRYDK